jgi:uncharacterized membrane protein YeaQ/YmgE (transglycosylase-associated protein family)
MSTETLLVILLIGAIAGWLAGQIVQGTGFGLIADIALGIVGAFIGTWLLPQLGIRVGTGIVAAIIAATIGAVVLLVILGFFGRGGGRYFRRGAVGGGGGGGRFHLTPPTFPVFIISLVLAVLALLVHYAGLRIPIITAANAFDALAIAYVVLLVGVLFRGL